MEKFEYVAPKIQVIVLKAKSAILVGSEEEAPGGSEEW